MRPLTPERILAVWEEAQGHGPTVRALALLAAASPETAWEELAALPLGERDRRLLALRGHALGPLAGFTRCPTCREPLDISLDTRELEAAAGLAPVEDTAAERKLSQDGLDLRFRPADSFDLLAAERCAGVEEARLLLAERCLLEARRGGAPVPAADLADEEVAILATGMAEADPGAELLLDLRCPACGHGWWEVLDVASFFWSELEVQARRLLREVYALARAFGWREADILALSPQRRRLYLEMVSG
jgi:hypothetical protein